MVQVENVEPYTICPAIPDMGIPQEVAVLEIESASPSVISLEAHAIREAFFRAKLQGIEFYAGVVAEIFYGLSPAKLSGRTRRTRLGIEKSALVSVESPETNDRGLVDIVIRTSRRDVLALVSHVCSGNDECGSELSLHCEVPGIHGGQSHGVVAGQ